MSEEKFTATLMNPVAKVETEEKITPAARMSSLEGKKIALWWNGQSKGNVALDIIAERLKEEYRVEAVPFRQGWPHGDDVYARVAEAGCVGAVAATADCGSASAWLARDVCALEKLGIPTVMLMAKAFFPICNAEFKLRGLRKASIAVMDHTLTGMTVKDHPFSVLPSENVKTVAEGCYDAVVAGLTSEDDSTDKLVAETRKFVEEEVADERITIEGEGYFDFCNNFNRYFVHHGWGDGLPLVAPTEEAVNRMLGGTKRDRNEVILKMDPGEGLATVEKIAVNCVMAGCEPGCLPVVIGALEAMSKENFCLSMVAQSTSACTPMIFVNGPIAKEIGMTAEGAALGPGKYAAVNTAIGRAVRLCMMNIGHAYPQLRDMNTIGSPNKYSLCACENEDDLPLGQPFNVEKGFKPGSNCVTAIPSQSFMDVEDLESGRPEDLLQTISATIDAVGWPGARGWMGYIHPTPMTVTLFMAPDHARLISKSGWTKQDAKDYMYAKCRRKLWQIRHLIVPRIEDGTICHAHRWLVNAPDDTLVPMFKEPSYVDIASLGGAAGKSALSLNVGRPVTIEIKG